MKPIQAEIVVENGIIRNIKHTPGLVKIISDGNVAKFDRAWLYPGFVDSHGHLFGLGNKLNSLNFEDCKSAEECVEKARTTSKLRGNWLVGRGWNQENWRDTSYPSKEIIDKVFPEIPVCFTRVDGHASWVNSKALSIASISPDTSNPAGGFIMKDGNGKPNGILIDNAMNLVEGFIPRLNDEQMEELILKADAELSRYGITEVHDMDVGQHLLPIYRRLDAERKVGIKVQSYIQAQNDEWEKNRLEVFQGYKFNIIGVKYFADGALGSRGAALLEPYSDEPANSGLLLLTETELFNKAANALESGYDIAVHAIGDAANRLVLNVFKELRASVQVSKDRILRIEHAQMVHPDEIGTFSKYNIHAAVQPIHCLSDAPMARKRTGTRTQYSYLWKTLQDSGAIISGGSDFPIESHNPLAGIDAFVNRIPFGENETWLGKETISIEEALDCYTYNAHLLSGKVGQRGSIEIGLEADFTILDKDITGIDKTEILETQVVATIVNGQIIFSKD